MSEKAKPSETIIAYLAGFFDGEGSIMLAQRVNRGSNETIITLKVGNTNREVLDLFRKTFNSGWVKGPIKLKNLHAKEQFCYVVGQQKAIRIVEQLYPYLVVKRKQAEALFALSNSMTNMSRTGISLPLSELELRRSYVHLMKTLNKRGVS